MSLQDKKAQLIPAWIRSSGPEGEVVLSSRIRLARNLKNIPFPHYAGEKALENVLDQVEKAIALSSNKKNIRALNHRLKLTRLDSLSQLERLVLVEKHLVSPNLINHPAHRGVVTNDDETLAVMVNEEDHIRIQILTPGLELEGAWETANEIDDFFEASLEYAFDETRGFLTSCPTNLGTGLRASVMVHLPGLVMVDQAKKVLSALPQVGLNVRGIYGEGTESKGNLFQISNQVTLGHSESDLISNLLSLTKQVIDQEKAVREGLIKESKVQMENKVYRAYGILTQARIISSDEAMRLLSDVLLGIECGLITDVPAKKVKELILLIRIAILQQLIGREMTAEERDYYRAVVIRDHLKG
ncbi:MAG TPA: protein arginine kinase [Firmicutes bacterium]|jgi:protein arginine kinase|nr:protein arginine kinase [Bacillota bacterium]